MLPLYHVHLDGFPAPAELSPLLEALPSTVEPWLRARLESGEPFTEEERERPRFAGVDLSIGEAYALLERMRQAGAVGHLVPARYRTPRLTLEEARRMAEQALHERVSRHHTLHAFHFEPVQLNVSASTPMFRVFQAFSQDMEDRGYIPASVSVYVDTQDGHIWAPAELSLLQEQLEDEGRRALGLPRTESPEGSSRLERRKRRGQVRRLKS